MTKSVHNVSSDPALNIFDEKCKSELKSLEEDLSSFEPESQLQYLKLFRHVLKFPDFPREKSLKKREKKSIEKHLENFS